MPQLLTLHVLLAWATSPLSLKLLRRVAGIPQVFDHGLNHVSTPLTITNRPHRHPGTRRTSCRLG